MQKKKGILRLKILGQHIVTFSADNYLPCGYLNVSNVSKF